MSTMEVCNDDSNDTLLMPPPSKRERKSVNGEESVINEQLSLPFISSVEELCGGGEGPSWRAEASTCVAMEEKQVKEHFNTNSRSHGGGDPSISDEIVKSPEHVLSEMQSPDECFSEEAGPQVGDDSCSINDEINANDGTQISVPNDDSKSTASSPSFGEPQVDTRFSDIIGHASAKLRIDELLLPLALPPSLCNSLLTGVRALPASILLYGPPGCGKTQLARAIAGEAQAAFLSVGPSDVLSKFVGESEASIRNLFQKAWDRAREMESRCAVLFLDEIDALGQSRGGTGGSQTSGDTASDGCSRRVLAELLIQLTSLAKKMMKSGNRSDEEEYENECYVRGCITNAKKDFVLNDPCSDKATMATTRVSQDENIIHLREKEMSDHTGASTRIIVVAATNRPDDCDPALLRRFSIRVHVGLPSHRDRKKIVGRLIRDIEHNITSSQLDQIVMATEGWSGSDLESLTREAAMAPIRQCLKGAARLKSKARKREQRQLGGDESTQEKPRAVTDTDQQAREFLLKGFQSLRPVTLDDFDDAISFWLGNQGCNHHVNGKSIGQMHQAVHYDSASSCEEEDS